MEYQQQTSQLLNIRCGDMSWMTDYGYWLRGTGLSENKSLEEAFKAGYKAGERAVRIEKSWDNDVDRMSGAFTQEEIDRANGW